MGKVIFWIVVVFALLFLLRLWNANKARARRDAEARKAAGPQNMVQCSQCGVFLPRADARLEDSAWRCRDSGCNAHDAR